MPVKRMNTDSYAQLLRLLYQRDTAQAMEYFADASHFSPLQARRLAYDPTTETREEQMHLRTCGRCLGLLSHLREAIDHPSACLLAEFAETLQYTARTNEVQLHLEVDNCRSCLVRLDFSLKVAVHRALLRAGRLPAMASSARPVLSAFVPVPVGLQSADSSSMIEVRAVDRERSVKARLWQVERGELEVVVRADGDSLAHSTLPLELVGQGGSWQGEVILSEEVIVSEPDDHGWIGRRVIGSSQILTDLLGGMGEGLALTVSLPTAGTTAAVQQMLGSEMGAAAQSLAIALARLQDSHQSQEVRVAAVQSIAPLGPAALTPEALTALRRMLDEVDSPLRAAAISTLEALAD